MPQVCKLPTEIETKVSDPLTALGVVLPVVLPSPMPPAGLASQQYAWLSTLIPQVV
jgi:hypothetical protein